MGCNQSTAFKTPRGSTKEVNAKLILALQRKKEQLTQDQKDPHYKTTFEKILLHMEKRRECLNYVKRAFKEYAVDDGLSTLGVQNAMSRLHIVLSVEEVLDLFNYVDLHKGKAINMKEFLVALSVEHVLGNIPFVDSVSPETVIVPEGEPEILVHHNEIRDMLDSIVTAYLIFDTKCEGFIRKSAVEKLMEESGCHKLSESSSVLPL